MFVLACGPADSADSGFAEGGPGGGVEQGSGDSTSSGGSSSDAGGETTTDESGSTTAAMDSSGSATGPNGVFDVGAGDVPDALDCDPDRIPDTMSFSLDQTIDVGVSTLQAAYYDTVRDEVTVLSFYGQGKVFDTAGNELRDVVVPSEALPSLDGGAYDAARDLALLVRQDCTLVEVDPATMTAVRSVPLGAMHSMSICAGVAIAPNGDLYLASYGTNEVVVVASSDFSFVLRENLATVGLPGVDGIAEIAGSDNFLVNSTSTAQAMIIDAAAQVVVPASPFGSPPLEGIAAGGTLDSMVTICGNGHTWLCDEYGLTCSDFAPEDGDKESCGCLVAG